MGESLPDLDVDSVGGSNELVAELVDIITLLQVAVATLREEMFWLMGLTDRPKDWPGGTALTIEPLRPRCRRRSAERKAG